MRRAVQRGDDAPGRVRHRHRHGEYAVGELVFDRSFGRAWNAVVLPAGYYLTNSAIPATVSETQDGRIRLDFTNPRPDEIAVLITARERRVTAAP